MEIKMILTIVAGFLLLTGAFATNDTYGYCTMDKYVFTDSQNEVLGYYDFTRQFTSHTDEGLNDCPILTSCQ